jgi:hypothetical protein
VAGWLIMNRGKDWRWERENEQLKADKVKLEESLKESERENGQLNADKVMLEESLERVEREKEEMGTYVVKLEVQLKEMVGHGQENALEEEEVQGEDGEPGVDVSMEPELVLGADMECEPLMENVLVMVLQGDKEMVLDADMDPEPVMEDVLQPVLKEDNREFVLEEDNMRLVLEDEEDLPLIDVGGDQPLSVSSPPVSDQPTLMRHTRESQGPGMVEHQLVEEVLDVSRRKSKRRTGAILRMEKGAAIEARLRSNVDSDLLQVVEIEGKGRAVQTLQPISCKAMWRLARVASWLLMNSGFSICIGDVTPFASLLKGLVDSGYEKVCSYFSIV